MARQRQRNARSSCPVCPEREHDAGAGGRFLPTAGIIADHYSFGHVLGRGGFSVVKAARPRAAAAAAEGERGGGWVAVKQMTWVSDTWRNRPGVKVKDQRNLTKEEVLKECELWRQVCEPPHDTIVHLHACFIDPSRANLVCDLMSGGAVWDVMIETGRRGIGRGLHSSTYRLELIVAYWRVSVKKPAQVGPESAFWGFR
jgi:hypothetical protein